MNWYIGVLKKYAVFQGRARRKEYWFFVLFNIIVTVVLVVDRRNDGYVQLGSRNRSCLSGVY